MRKTITGTALALAALLLVMYSYGALVGTVTVSNSGVIGLTSSTPSLGLYSDSGCTTALNSISWGTIGPGDVSTETMYVKNEGSSAVSLSITTENWNPPSASDYFTLTWNLQGGVLQPGGVVQALLTLNVSSNISGITNFSFNILVSASQ